ncbi:MAG: isoleucyl-tRNA synthetase [Limisphaerales bacterium]|nr:MAG: isoleucyl-tRNA synthetase [Limisphaerales bacterium]KAG0507953.1 MAG: isoleucyl-tRNA synthetase [Limisphaerales bacterium]TXT48335.1 MAG: isoleucyl-tRNA synthetase [Limisphaerales bacterium]
MDYKNTLNLPRTDFAMKADLVAREPQRLARWEADQIYAQIRAARAGKPKFVLHDGPPFANGDVHVGTALNKVLKDIIVKYKSLRGFDAPYIPGWDCHGLPIEFKVTQDLQKRLLREDPQRISVSDFVKHQQGEMPEDVKALVLAELARRAGEGGLGLLQFISPATIRRESEFYARKYIDLQRTQFKRLGVFGDWANPYLTLNKEYEADELRLFADLVAQGFVYRGKKPVYWSIPCRTALAEAEVEYADHVSQSVFVKFKLAGEPNTFLLIWTTTPWTLPANLAVAFNPSLFYSRIFADGNVYLVCNSLLETVSQKCGWAGGYQIERTVSADELATLTYEHPFCARTGRLFPADFVTADTGTGFVHIAPGHGADDYNLGRSQGLPIYSPVDDAGCLAHTADLPTDQQMPAEMLGKSILEKHGRSDANDAVLHELRVRNALAHQENYHHSYPHCWRSKTPIIFRAMDQWFVKIDHVVGTRCRASAEAPSSQNDEAAQQRGPTGTSATESTSLEAIAKHLGSEVVSGLAQLPISAEALRSLSATDAWKYRCLPLRLDGEQLTVALVDPLNPAAVDELEFTTHRKVKVVVAQPDEVIAALEKHYSEGRQDACPTFRQRALAEIDRVNWIPDWGKNRIEGAVKSRPDWCISRQRSWGVPIPAFYDAQGEPILDAAIVRKAADLFEQHGSNVWFEKTAAELWALCRPADWTGREATAKSSDTLDVWIDSGSSSRAVLMRREELQHRSAGVQPASDAGAEPNAGWTPALPWQADVYLEGSDQHRGWFQSSLLLSLAGNGAAPFKTVLTHGFMVDEDREKISKSKQGQGAYTKPQTADRYVNEYGADVLRLWVASQDYRNDIVVSEERLKKVSETYRGIRNTLRYQLSNLYDFDPARHTVPDAQLTGLDRWVLGEFAKLEAAVAAAYDAYEFHVVYQKLSQFAAVELSSIYHDVVKDRLYTDPANSARRRSTQTALHRMVTRLCQMLAPILVFTADEAWEFIPGKPAPSVHLSEWEPKAFEEQATWNEVHFKLREMALAELEKSRQAKLIGKSLEAKLVWTVDKQSEKGTRERLDVWRELFNVSEVEVDVANPTEKASFVVKKADGAKCERCWHWEFAVGTNAEHPTLCPRCVEAVRDFKA